MDGLARTGRSLEGAVRGVVLMAPSGCVRTSFARQLKCLAPVVVKLPIFDRANSTPGTPGAEGQDGVAVALGSELRHPDYPMGLNFCGHNSLEN